MKAKVFNLFCDILLENKYITDFDNNENLIKNKSSNMARIYE